MNESLSAQLLEECIDLAIEDGATDTPAKFSQCIQELLPPDILSILEDIHGDSTFLEDIWKERFEVVESEDPDAFIEDGCCLVCEREVRLTRHHVRPREVHKQLIKKGLFTPAELNATISICRMCHSTVHRFFTNEVLAKSYYTLELLMADEKFHKYARWASTQADHSYKR